MLRKHKNEEEVKSIADLPKKSKRRDAFRLLARKGDYEFNMQSLKKHSTELCVVRQVKRGSDKTPSSEDFVPCTHCFGFFHAPTLFKHVKRCPMKIQTVDKQPLASSRVLLSVELSGGKFSDVHTLILSKMTKRDEAYILTKNDTTLLMFAATYLQSKEKDRYSDIRYSLRILANLVLKFQELLKVDCARAIDLVLPENYDEVLEAAKIISGYTGPREIRKPNVFRKIGFCLSNLVLIVRASALRKNVVVLLNLEKQTEKYMRIMLWLRTKAEKLIYLRNFP